MRNRLLKVLFLIIAVCVFMAMAIGSGSSNTPAQQGTGTGASTNHESNENPSKDDKVEYSVGETSVVVWTDSIGTKYVKVAVPVTNTGNVNLYLESSSIDLENPDGSLAQTVDYVSAYPQIIKPGETAYYFEETTYDGTATEGLKAVPHVKAEKSKVDIVRLEVSDLQIKTKEYFGACAMGRVLGTDQTAERSVYVVANFFDKDGKFLGHQIDILLGGIPAGEKMGFETSTLSSRLAESDIASYDVVAFPYQYNW